MVEQRRLPEQRGGTPRWGTRARRRDTARFQRFFAPLVVPEREFLWRKQTNPRISTQRVSGIPRFPRTRVHVFALRILNRLQGGKFARSADGV